MKCNFGEQMGSGGSCARTWWLVEESLVTQIEGKHRRPLNREAETSHWPSVPIEMPTVSFIWKSSEFFLGTF